MSAFDTPIDGMVSGAFVSAVMTRSRTLINRAAGYEFELKSSSDRYAHSLLGGDLDAPDFIPGGSTFSWNSYRFSSMAHRDAA